MIVYEVNLSIDNDVAEEMAVWLRAHIGEMLEIDGFERAAWYFREPEDRRQRWCVHYYLTSQRHLDEYFARHAERMRGDGSARFGGRFAAERRVLYEREVFQRAT